MTTEFAYVTGGASGLGKAVATMLAKKHNVKVFIADRDLAGAEKVAADLGGYAGQVEVREWKDQVKSFSQALSKSPNGRIDYVYGIAGVGERRWLPEVKSSSEGSDLSFEMPDLSVLDIDLSGVMYTTALAVQQFRRQEPNASGWRGKIGVISSVCGMYCCPTLPIYTAAKHGVIGFVRSYGKYLPEEKIALNAVLPNVVRTNISTQAFYDSLEEKGLLTPMEGVVDAFEKLLTSNDSGECYEIGPNYAKGQGIIKPTFVQYVDDESKIVFDQLYGRARPLQLPN